MLSGWAANCQRSHISSSNMRLAIMEYRISSWDLEPGRGIKLIGFSTSQMAVQLTTGCVCGCPVNGSVACWVLVVGCNSSSPPHWGQLGVGGAAGGCTGCPISMSDGAGDEGWMLG